MRFGPGRRPGRPPKFIRLEITSENGEKCDDGTQVRGEGKAGTLLGPLLRELRTVTGLKHKCLTEADRPACQHCLLIKV